ncbi:MAG TPA: hypothetical protein VEJ63_15800, partial [Planctomycetota bacterium]|nr:hypothetical protein [Planctomycetota bacterium]
MSGRWIRGVVSRWTFQRRIRAAIPATGSDQRFLLAVADAIRHNREERAFFLLEDGKLRAPTPAARHALRWLTALAGVRWLARQRPGRQISSYYQHFPQIYALLYAYPGSHVPLRTQVLSREIDVVTSDELDELASGYIALIDELVASLSNSKAPFSDEAQDLLEFLTGESHVLHPAARYTEWWKKMRP